MRFRPRPGRSAGRPLAVEPAVEPYTSPARASSRAWREATWAMSRSLRWIDSSHVRRLPGVGWVSRRCRRRRGCRRRSAAQEAVRRIVCGNPGIRMPSRPRSEFSCQRCFERTRHWNARQRRFMLKDSTPTEGWCGLRDFHQPRSLAEELDERALVPEGIEITVFHSDLAKAGPPLERNA